MGCDIEILIEGKNSEGNWEEIELSPYELYPDERWYDLWGFLFGIRGDFWKKGVFDARGLPNDCSDLDWKEDHASNVSGDPYNMGNWFGYTYILLHEIKDIQWPKEFDGCYFKDFLNYIIPRLMSSYKFKDIRILFRFNS